MAMAPKTPRKAQKIGIKLPVSWGLVLRYPNQYDTGYGMCFHGGGGTNGLRNRSMLKFQLWWIGMVMAVVTEHCYRGI